MFTKKAHGFKKKLVELNVRAPSRFRTKKEICEEIISQKYKNKSNQKITQNINQTGNKIRDENIDISYLNSLPLELREKVLISLPYDDIINYCMTSKESSQICEDDNFWKDKAKLEDIPEKWLMDSNFNISQRYGQISKYKGCLINVLNESVENSLKITLEQNKLVRFINLLDLTQGTIKTLEHCLKMAIDYNDDVILDLLSERTQRKIENLNNIKRILLSTNHQDLINMVNKLLYKIKELLLGSLSYSVEKNNFDSAALLSLSIDSEYFYDNFGRKYEKLLTVVEILVKHDQEEIIFYILNNIIGEKNEYYNDLIIKILEFAAKYNNINLLKYMIQNYDITGGEISTMDELIKNNNVEGLEYLLENTPNYIINDYFADLEDQDLVRINLDVLKVLTKHGFDAYMDAIEYAKNYNDQDMINWLKNKLTIQD